MMQVYLNKGYISLTSFTLDYILLIHHAISERLDADAQKVLLALWVAHLMPGEYALQLIGLWGCLQQ